MSAHQHHSREHKDPYRSRGSPHNDTTDPEMAPYTFTQHSRTASDSSTSRLTSSRGASRYPDESYDPLNDPYAASMRQEKRAPLHDNEQLRANSYLPYSHHRRNSNEPNVPIYLDSPRAVGSILQDNITVDMMDQTSDSPTKRHLATRSLAHQPLPRSKRKGRRWCGLKRRTFVYIVFAFIVVVTLVWYFVWPRTPTLLFNSASMVPDSSSWSSDSSAMQATWNVTLSVDNTANWVPTHISNLEVAVIDGNTQKSIGQGNTGALVLPPRTRTSVQFNAAIAYAAPMNNSGDPTWTDISNACGAQEQNPTPETPEQPRSLNVNFRVTYHIAGIAWTSIADVRPLGGFSCPSS